MIRPLARAADPARRAATLAARALVTRTGPGRSARETALSDRVIAPGAHVAKHARPGSERRIALEGGPVTLPDGAAAEVPAGMARHFERGVVHAGITNAGATPIRLITMHIVDKGKPLNVPAEWCILK